MVGRGRGVGNNTGGIESTKPTGVINNGFNGTNNDITVDLDCGKSLGITLC